MNIHKKVALLKLRGNYKKMSLKYAFRTNFQFVYIAFRNLVSRVKTAVTSQKSNGSRRQLNLRDELQTTLNGDLTTIYEK